MPAKPNVIVFLTDQQRWDTLGVAGNPVGVTPNLDRMSTRGCMFDVACATNPVCAPSRAALLTGRYPTEAGVWRNGEVLGPDIPTLARSFKEAGYRTGYIGKWHLSESNPVPPAERADWDFWLASNLLEFTSDAYRTILYDNDGAAVELPGYRSDAIVDAAIRFIADQADEPFFLFVSQIEPHQQNEHDDYPAPEVYRNTYTGSWLPPDLVAQRGGTAAQHIGGYYGQIKRVDEGFGRIRDALLSLEIESNTIVSYTADHGSHFKTRNREYKRSVHDGSIRVPLLLEGPGVVPGRRVTEPVSTVDLVPTLLDLAGISPLPGAQGLPLSRYFSGAAQHSEPVLVQVSESETGRGIRSERWKYYVVAEGDGSDKNAPVYLEQALYDLDADPYELDNLIGGSENDDVIAQLRDQLIARIRAIEGVEVSISLHDRVPRLGRAPETTVRSQGIRGSRFGHQPAVARADD